MNSTIPAQRKPMATRKWKTCRPSKKTSFHVFRLFKLEGDAKIGGILKDQKVISSSDSRRRYVIRLTISSVSLETENNAYAKFWGDKQRALWYVMVFLERSILVDYTGKSAAGNWKRSRKRMRDLKTWRNVTLVKRSTRNLKSKNSACCLFLNEKIIQTV